MEPEVSEWVRETLDRKHRLARSLLEIAYGEGAWKDADEELRANYHKDAWDILMSSPHLLTLEAVENLTALDLLKFDPVKED